jgi:hypothetical protein
MFTRVKAHFKGHLKNKRASKSTVADGTTKPKFFVNVNLFMPKNSEGRIHPVNAISFALTTQDTN